MRLWITNIEKGNDGVYKIHWTLKENEKVGRNNDMFLMSVWDKDTKTGVFYLEEKSKLLEHSAKKLILMCGPRGSPRKKGENFDKNGFYSLEVSKR